MSGPGEDLVEGPSFPVGSRALATLFVALLLLTGWRAFEGAGAAGVDRNLLLLMLAMAGVIGVSWWRIMTDRTRFDGEHIEQRGLWSRRVAVAEITQVRLIEPPVLAWLIVPRLRVRTRSTGITTMTFHIGDARVLAAVRLLAYGMPGDGKAG